MNWKAAALLFVAVLVLGTFETANAFNLRFLKHTDGPAKEFTEGDMEILRATARRALEEASDRDTLAWSNEETAHSGSVTPLGQVSGPGDPCRRTQFVNTAGDITRTTLWTLCRQPDGDWKVAGPGQSVPTEDNKTP